MALGGAMPTVFVTVIARRSGQPVTQGCIVQQSA
jgi:hypothetical protein